MLPTGSGSVADCPVPYLADLVDIVDAAPEGLEMVAGIAALRPSCRLHPAGA